MKTLIALVVAFTFLLSTELAARPGDSRIIGGHVKNKSLFVFKAKKKYVGATVEVYSSQGTLVTAQSLRKRKMIIDFGDVRQDTYTIRITKGSSKKEYQFIKG